MIIRKGVWANRENECTKDGKDWIETEGEDVDGSRRDVVRVSRIAALSRNKGIRTAGAENVRPEGESGDGQLRRQPSGAPERCRLATLPPPTTVENVYRIPRAVIVVR